MNITFSAEDRKGWMSLLASADEARLTELWQDYGEDPAFEFLRAPESGGVMVRGRMGGTGAPFNLGEMTVTRCVLSLSDGAVGYAYVQGRSKAKSEIAAKIDALMQTSAAEALNDAVLAPLAHAQQTKKTARAAKAAATKVEFFTMVRGED